MERIAIIGSGIAGLGAARALHGHAEILLFDRNRHAGGHTNTRAVDGRPVDTGFMVYNEVTYPNLTRLFEDLAVETVETSMSFGVQFVPAGLEYCGTNIDGLFAQRRNLLRPSFLRALAGIARFNREARAALEVTAFRNLTIQQYCELRGYGEEFLRFYLLPMGSAVWSTPFDEFRSFPAMTLLRFFDNHGLLGGLSGHHQWRTVAGGARTYVERMTRPFRDRIVLGNGVTRIRRTSAGVTMHLEDGSTAAFDRVVLACHADEALRLLEQPTPAEQRMLGAFRYQENVALLHTDPAPMPRNRRAWASWNYRYDDRGASTVYWMNRLQPWLAGRRDCFVSIDDPGLVDPSRVVERIVYHHPLFDRSSVDAQAELPRLNGGRTFYCGSYFRYGFHEDALASGLAAADALLGELRKAAA
jgi:predicted NAD/FAD-binding protein